MTVLSNIVELYSNGQADLELGQEIEDERGRSWIVTAIGFFTVQFAIPGCNESCSIQTTWLDSQGELTWLGHLVHNTTHFQYGREVHKHRAQITEFQENITDLANMC